MLAKESEISTLPKERDLNVGQRERSKGWSMIKISMLAKERDLKAGERDRYQCSQKRA